MSDTITRETLLDGRLSVEELAAKFGYTDARKVAGLIKDHAVPVVVINRNTYARPDAFLDAIEKPVARRAYRRRAQRAA